MDYETFLQQKQQYGAQSGFDPLWMPDFLYDFQQYLTEWAIKLGRAAIFADCGLGKTPMQLVWAQNVIQHTNQSVLILAPLGVTGQTLYEADKFGVEAQRAQPGMNGHAVIEVTNYEKLHLFEPDGYGGVVCDESSILKNFDGVRRQEITEFMRTMPYRLLCTATAAPNDWVELGTSSEALGYLGQRDMKTRFFKREQNYVRRRAASTKGWRMRPWAAEGPFWQWLSSWARTVRMPSDLGFDDNGFILPPLETAEVCVDARTPTPGMLFDMPANTFRQEREAIRRTIQERCEAAAEAVEKNGSTSMVWVNLNDEGDLMEDLLPGAVQVAGRHSDEKKEEAARWFVRGNDERRILISKPSIFGFGLNFQHCAHMTYFPTWSYEQYYQASRRLWRFGQTRPVKVDLVYTDGGKRALAGLRRKGERAMAMFDNLVQHMSHELHIEERYTAEKVEVPQWMK